MSLQVRLRHALGERLVDLAERSAERPLIIGRAREADVKVPSVTVGNEHCVLFVHEGQWVLQDTSGGATYINGSALDGPTPLCVGDVITLGSDGNPATLEIDPAGAAAGRTGYPVGVHVPALPPRLSAAAPGSRLCADFWWLHAASDACRFVGVGRNPCGPGRSVCQLARSSGGR